MYCYFVIKRYKVSHLDLEYVDFKDFRIVLE